MAYHEAFWVTLGTVAPLVGLAHGVAVGKNSQRAVLYRRGLRRRVIELETRIEATTRPDGALGSLVQALGAESDDETDLDPYVLRDLHERTNRLIDELKAIDDDLHSTLLSKQERYSLKAALWADVITVVSFILCGASLLAALLSLAWERNFMVPTWAAVMLLLPTFLIVLTTAVDLFTSTVFEPRSRP